jgi:hypothetical protein
MVDLMSLGPRYFFTFKFGSEQSQPRQNVRLPSANKEYCHRWAPEAFTFLEAYSRHWPGFGQLARATQTEQTLAYSRHCAGFGQLARATQMEEA